MTDTLAPKLRARLHIEAAQDCLDRAARALNRGDWKRVQELHTEARVHFARASDVLSGVVDGGDDPDAPGPDDRELRGVVDE